MHKGLLVWILSNLTGLVLAHSGNSAVSEEMMSPNPLSGQWAEHRDSYLFRHNPDAGWLNIKKEPRWISTPDKWAAVISHCDDQECYPIIDETETAESESPTVSALYAEMTREYSLAGKQTLNANFAPAPSPLITVIFESSLGLIRPFWLSVSDYMALPQPKKPEQDSDMENHTGREQAQDGSDRLQEIIKQKKSPPRQPIIILEGEFEEEKRLLYFDHYDHLSIAPVKPVEHDWYHTITIDNAHIGWQDLSGEMKISLLFENTRHNEFDSGFYEEMAFLTRLFGHNRIVLRYTNNSGEIIYEYKDHYGRIRTVTAEELKQWLSERRQAMLEKVYPKFFGTALLPGGGEKPELWRQEHRHVPFSTLRLIARLIIESEEKIDLRHSIARNIRKVPGNEEPNKKNAPAPDPDNPSCKVSQTKALHHPGNNEPDQTPLTSHEQLDSTPKRPVISLRDRLDSIIEKSVGTEDLLSHLDAQILDELADITRHDNGDVLSYLIKKLTDRELLDSNYFWHTTGVKLIPILLLIIESNEYISYENYCRCVLKLSKTHLFSDLCHGAPGNFLKLNLIIDYLLGYILRFTYKKIEDRLKAESLDGEQVLCTLKILEFSSRPETLKALTIKKKKHVSKKSRELAIKLLLINIADIAPNQALTVLKLFREMIHNQLRLDESHFQKINNFLEICQRNFLSFDNSQIIDLFFSAAMLGEMIQTTHIINLVQSLSTHSKPLAFDFHDRVRILQALGIYHARFLDSEYRIIIQENMRIYYEELIKNAIEKTKPIKARGQELVYYRIWHAIEVAAFWLGRQDDIPKENQERTTDTQYIRPSHTQNSVQKFLKAKLNKKIVSIAAEQRLVYFLGPVDILLINKKNGKQVIVEVQGPHHYVDGKKTKNGNTLLKLTILKKMGYKVLTPDVIDIGLDEKEERAEVGEKTMLLRYIKAYLGLKDANKHQEWRKNAELTRFKKSGLHKQAEINPESDVSHVPVQPFPGLKVTPVKATNDKPPVTSLVTVQNSLPEPEPEPELDFPQASDREEVSKKGTTLPIKKASLKKKKKTRKLHKGGRRVYDAMHSKQTEIVRPPFFENTAALPALAVPKPILKKTSDKEQPVTAEEPLEQVEPTSQLISQTLLAEKQDLPQAGGSEKVSKKDTALPTINSSLKKNKKTRRSHRQRRRAYNRSKKASLQKPAMAKKRQATVKTDDLKPGNSKKVKTMQYASQVKNKQLQKPDTSAAQNQQTIAEFVNTHFSNLYVLNQLYTGLTGDMFSLSAITNDSSKQWRSDHGNNILQLFQDITSISRADHFELNDLPKFLPFMSFLYCNVRYFGSSQLIKVFIHYVDSWPLVSKPEGISEPLAPVGVAATATIFKIQHMFIKRMINEILARNREDIKELLPDLSERIRALSMKLMAHDHLMSYILDKAEKKIRED